MPQSIYIYSKKVNPITLKSEIESSPDITIGLDSIKSTETSVSAIMKDTLSTIQEDALSGIVVSHTYTIPKAETYSINNHGKLLVQSTTRPSNFTTYFTSEGDDISSHTNIGGGEPMFINHQVGDAVSGSIDCWFNTLDNPSRIYEGYLTWKDCLFDKISLIASSNACSGNTVSGGNYLENDGLILPCNPGEGNWEFTEDILEPWGGLTEMPLNDDGERPQAFWNADWDTNTGKFINLSPAPAGDGKYNIFTQHTPLARFANDVVLLNYGTISFDSEDATQLSHGMHLHLEYVTNTAISGDHNWQVALTLVLHRSKTI